MGERILDLLDTDHLIKDCKGSGVLESYNDDLIFENIHFSYQENKPLFNDLSFRINKNSLLGIVGQTGAGKTTLINCVSGTIQDYEGEVHFNGENLNNLVAHKRARRGISRSFQIPKPFTSMTSVVYRRASRPPRRPPAAAQPPPGRPQAMVYPWTPASGRAC